MEAIWVGATEQRPLGEVPAGAVVVSEGGSDPWLVEVRGSGFFGKREGKAFRRFMRLDRVTGERDRMSQRPSSSPCRLAVRARVLKLHIEPAPVVTCEWQGCDGVIADPKPRQRYCSGTCRSRACKARLRAALTRVCARTGCEETVGPEAERFCSRSCAAKDGEALKRARAAKKAKRVKAAVARHREPTDEAAPKPCEREGCDKPAVRRFCSTTCHHTWKRARRLHVEPTRSIDIHKPQPEKAAPEVEGLQLTTWWVWGTSRVAFKTEAGARDYAREKLGPGIFIGPGAIKKTSVMRPPELGADGLYRFPGGAEADDFGNVRRTG